MGGWDGNVLREGGLYEGGRVSRNLATGREVSCGEFGRMERQGTQKRSGE